MPKTLIPFVQSPYQNRKDLGRLGGLDKGFYGNYRNTLCHFPPKK